MKFYHYTYKSRLEIMQISGGLHAHNGMHEQGKGRTMAHPYDNDERHALWGLQEPIPEEWKNHYLWDLLVGKFCYTLRPHGPRDPKSIILLECEVSDIDDIWVADWGGYYQRFGQKDAYDYYKGSMIPYKDYDQIIHQMVAPELISFSDIPMANTKIVLELPFDESFETIRTFVKEHTGIWHGEPSTKKAPRLKTPAFTL